MTWRVAEALDVLLDEINDMAPGRSKASDGSIGDAAHASRSSDHNPWVTDTAGVGVVRARDFTHDPASGLNCHQLAEHLGQLLNRHPALGPGAYIIWNHFIVSADRAGEGWRHYSGTTPHTKHLHLSVALEQARYDSPAPWGLKEDDMTIEELRAELRRNNDELIKRIRTLDIDPGPRRITLAGALRYLFKRQESSR